ncbi:putative lipid II flippase FtsW [Dasania marina]|uniref:putative lipid II flippase FtsW n=1 Tax=Dasania marina TaxID=471499 RepID=UPI000377A3F4|nr:putative lipid II flippase FtsW [Dasania marina]
MMTTLAKNTALKSKATEKKSGSQGALAIAAADGQAVSVRVLAGCIVALILIGFVAMSSASIEFAAYQYGNPFFHITRYGFHLAVALVGAMLVYRVPMNVWERCSPLLLFAAFILLTMVLIPGVGREVNGSRRWLSLGVLTLQASELAKVCVILYLSGYLVRRQQELRASWTGFVKPMAVLFFITLLLMLEPDFGATVVTVGTAFGMLFLAGVKLGQFLLVILSSLMALVLLIATSPYRLQRWLAFSDPWADEFKFGSGYQLTQSLIAFGRGEWFGVGLGNSIQKLFFLPESHTDFVFAIYAEEFGVVGSLLLLALFAALIMQILKLGRLAEQMLKPFHAYVAYGIALMLSSQVFINIGVNTGMLPTKGLTLPFLSYGGSSLIVCCALMAMVFRIYAELHQGAATVSHKKQREVAT